MEIEQQGCPLGILVAFKAGLLLARLLQHTTIKPHVRQSRLEQQLSSAKG